MTEHIHGSGCINTYPDCAYPSEQSFGHSHGGVVHEHSGYVPGHLHAEYDVPDSPGNYGAAYPAERQCSIPACENPTDRKGQPCDPCDVELGVGA